LERQLASLHKPLPSTGVTRLPRYCEPLRHPSRPGLSLASCQLTHTAITAGTSRVALGPLCLHAVANYPDRFDGTCSLVPFHQLRPSLDLRRVGSCIGSFEACTAFTLLRPARSPSRLSDPLHQRLQPLRCLRCCSDCYRVERTSSRAGIPPLWTSAFHGALRTFLNEFVSSVPRSVRLQYGNCLHGIGGDDDAKHESTGWSNCLALEEAPSPLVSLPSDLNIQQLAEIGLQLAGMSATQARELCQTFDWKSTLVLPGYVLIWVKDGIIYCLAGQGDSSKAVTLANSLD